MISPHDVIEWGKAIGVVVGLPVHMVVSGTILWQTLRQNRELKVGRDGIRVLLTKTGSIHPPQFAPKKRQQSLLELEQMIRDAEKEEQD